MPARWLGSIAALAVLMACESPPTPPFEMSWVSIDMRGAREADVHFAMRDAHRVAVPIEGTLTLEVRAEVVGAEADAGVALCRASGAVPRSAYRGAPMEAAVTLHFDSACARAEPGREVSATVTLEDAHGTPHRWPGVRGPFTAWMEPLSPAP